MEKGEKEGTHINSGKHSSYIEHGCMYASRYRILMKTLFEK